MCTLCLGPPAHFPAKQYLAKPHVGFPAQNRPSKSEASGFPSGPDVPDLLDVMRHVIEEFDLRLDELHNDSTTVSFFGAYDQASEAGQRRGRKTLTLGAHSFVTTDP